MKLFFFTAVFTGLFPGIAFAQQHSLIDLEKKWVVAIQKQDTAFLKELLSDNFTDITWKGTLRYKKDMLHVKRSSIVSQKLSDLKGRIYGRAGIVTGVNTVWIFGCAHPVQIRFTDVFIREKGVWRAVSAQESLMQ